MIVTTAKVVAARRITITGSVIDRSDRKSWEGSRSQFGFFPGFDFGSSVWAIEKSWEGSRSQFGFFPGFDFGSSVWAIEKSWEGSRSQFGFFPDFDFIRVNQIGGLTNQLNNEMIDLSKVKQRSNRHE
jgi:hypothetical protein